VTGGRKLDSTDPLVVDGHRFDAFAIIPLPDRNAGLSVLMTFALNGVRNAIKRNWLPVVFFDGKFNRFFHEPDRGDNIWEYYWLPVMGVSHAELQAMLACGQISAEQVHTFTIKETWFWHFTDPERIGTFWLGETPADPDAWMREKRALGQRYVDEYIRVRPEILEKVKAIERMRTTDTYRIGVHIRGTDFSYAQATAPVVYYDVIDRLVRDQNLSDFRVFLATDQQQFVDAFARRYPNRLLTYDSARSSNDIPPFKRSDVSPYKKGEDVLIDILLLSHCDHVLKGAASVGEYALWFNSSVPYTDFAVHSRHLRETYVVSSNAFADLNVDGDHAVKRRIRRLHSVCEKFIEKEVLQFDSRAWKNPRIFLYYTLRYLRRKLPRALRHYASRAYRRLAP